MCDTDKIGLIPSAATLEKLKVQPDEVLVIKIDTRYYDLGQASIIYQEIVDQLPAGINCVGIPSNIELEPTLINHLIQNLEELL